MKKAFRRTGNPFGEPVLFQNGRVIVGILNSIRFMSRSFISSFDSLSCSVLKEAAG